MTTNNQDILKRIKRDCCARCHKWGIRLGDKKCQVNHTWFICISMVMIVLISDFVGGTQYDIYFEVANDETETRFCFTVDPPKFDDKSKPLLKVNRDDGGDSSCCRFPSFHFDTNGHLKVQGSTGKIRCLEAVVLNGERVRLEQEPCRTRYRFENANLKVTDELCVLPAERETRLVLCQTLSMKTFRFISDTCKNKVVATESPPVTYPASSSASLFSSSDKPMTSPAPTTTEPVANAYMISKTEYLGMRLLNHAYKQIQGISLLQCIEACLSDTRCESINAFIISPMQCELNDAKSDEHKDDFKLKENFIYYNAFR